METAGSGEQHDIAEIVQSDVQPARDPDEGQKTDEGCSAAIVNSTAIDRIELTTIARVAAMKKPGGVEQEGVCKDREQVDEAQHLGGDAQRPRAASIWSSLVVTVMSRTPAARVAERQRDFPFIGAVKEVPHRNIGRSS